MYMYAEFNGREHTLSIYAVHCAILTMCETITYGKYKYNRAEFPFISGVVHMVMMLVNIAVIVSCSVHSSRPFARAAPLPPPLMTSITHSAWTI